MPSFDIVCEVDYQEVDNAVNQTAKEIASRFDFRGGKSKVEFSKDKNTITIVADDEMKLRSLHQILEMKLAKRQVDCRALAYQEPREATGNTLHQIINLKQGLEREEAKQIIKKINDLKLKVSSQVMDDQVRVTGKKIDELQAVISTLKESDLNLPLQFINMRS